MGGREGKDGAGEIYIEKLLSIMVYIILFGTYTKEREDDELTRDECMHSQQKRGLLGKVEKKRLSSEGMWVVCMARR